MGKEIYEKMTNKYGERDMREEVIEVVGEKIVLFEGRLAR